MHVLRGNYLVAAAVQTDEAALVTSRVLSYVDRLFWISIGIAALSLTTMAVILATL